MKNALKSASRTTDKTTPPLALASDNAAPVGKPIAPDAPIAPADAAQTAPAEVATTTKVKKARVYSVVNIATKAVMYVKANNKSKAMLYVAASLLKVETCTGEAMYEVGKTGAEIHDATGLVVDTE